MVLNENIEHSRLASNVTKLLTMVFFRVFLVIVPIAVPFFQSKGLSMAQVFELQAWFGFVVAIGEVPSGYVADLIGRKWTLVAGAFFVGVGHSLLLFAQGFWTLAMFETSLGVAASLTSGTDLAMIYDTELALGRSERELQRGIGRLHFMHSVSEALAAVAASLVLLWGSMSSVVYVQVAVGWLPLAFALTLIEPPRETIGALGDGLREHLGHLGEILRRLLLDGAVLRLTFLAMSIWSLTTFYAVWILQKYWEVMDVELMFFGYLWAFYMIAGGLAGRFADALEDKLGATGVLTLAGVLPAIGYAALASGSLGVAIVFSLAFFLARGVGAVVMRHAMNRRVPSRYRATANSLASLGFRLGFVVTGPIVGHVLDLWGMTTTLTLLALGTLGVFAALIVPLILAARESERVALVEAAGVAQQNVQETAS